MLLMLLLNIFEFVWERLCELENVRVWENVRVCECGLSSNLEGDGRWVCSFGSFTLTSFIILSKLIVWRFVRESSSASLSGMLRLWGFIRLVFLIGEILWTIALGGLIEVAEGGIVCMEELTLGMLIELMLSLSVLDAFVELISFVGDVDVIVLLLLLT